MMTGNGTAASSKSSKAMRRPVVRASAVVGGLRTWDDLDPEDRLALIESALKIPANDFADDLPLAL